MTFLTEVVDGLSASPKTLPCKYFYDARGSELFEEICDLEEYYVTRADLAATKANIDAIGEALGSGIALVELGSGASVKTRLLLDALDDVRAYIPIDISPTALEQSAEALRRDYPDLDVLPLCADYTKPVSLPAPSREPTRNVVYYPGSTIGNFHPPNAIAFMRRIRKVGCLLLGVDLKKDKQRLERAYDDAKGVTAAFNLNLLTRINRELGANFDLDAFEHVARYDDALGRIEMWIRCTRAHSVTIGDHEIAFAGGDMIRTEESYKYSLDELAAMAAEAGYTVSASWLDPEGLFTLQWMT